MAETNTTAPRPQKAGWLTRLFGFDGSKMKVSTEILAGITTFLAMSYILAVNPSILADTGMDKNALFTTTAIAAIIGTLVMALYAKLPFALAPGMGLNAFFCYSVCLGMGYSWQFALTAVLIEGFIFVILTLTNVREAIVNALPKSMRKAIGAGIGLFIALIGLKSGGIVVDSPATLVDLGSLTSGPGLLSVIGLILTGILVILNVPGALLIGIIATALIGIPMGITKFSGIISTPPNLSPIFCKFDFTQVFSLDMLVVVFTFLFIDMFDTIGTLVGVTTKADMVDEDGKPIRLNRPRYDGRCRPRYQHRHHLCGERFRRRPGRTQRPDRRRHGRLLRPRAVLRPAVHRDPRIGGLPGARDRGSLHAEPDQGHPARRFLRVDPGVPDAHPDADDLFDLARHHDRPYFLRRPEPLHRQDEEGQSLHDCPGHFVRPEIHFLVIC